MMPNSRKERPKYSFNGIFSGRNEQKQIPMIKSRKNLLSPRPKLQSKVFNGLMFPPDTGASELKGNKI